MPFAEYEDFDECVRKNKDKEDPKAHCAEIKRKTEKSVQSIDVFDESDTPAIDKVVDKFAKGGPGSGQKGHTTQKQKEVAKKKLSDAKTLKTKGELMRGQSEKFSSKWVEAGHIIREADKKIDEAAKVLGREVAHKIIQKSPISKTPTIDALIAKGGPGSGQKGHKTSDLRKHSQYTSSDYSALKKKGYTDKEISGIWDKDKKSGKKPLHRKEIPKMDESVKAKKISERLKSESTSKTPAIDELIAKGGPGSGQKGHKTVHEKHQENRKDFISFMVKMKKRGMDNDDIVNMLSELKITKTLAIDALIAKGGVGSGVKGHTTAKELAIKKKFGELDKARNKADALAEKDIRDGQRMIDKAAKESETAFEETLRLGPEGSEAQFKKISEKRERIKQQEKAGWDLRIKGQNRKAEISDKYQAAAMKLMGIHSDSRTEVPTERMDEGIAGEPFKSKVISHEDSMIKVENTIKEIFPKYPLDYSGDLVTVSTLGNGDTLLSAYVPTSDRGTDPNIGEPSKKEFSSYEDKWKPSMARLQNALRIKGFRDMKVTLDYGEKGHIGLRVSGTLEKVKPLEDKPKGGKEQPTLTRDAPKHTPKSNLLATKHAEAAVKRGTLFKELGKKSKKELKGMIQQDSKVDMAGSLKQMTKSDMKYHITSGKYPSPKGSEEAYNALTKQERKGLLKPIPDPKTPKAKGSEPPKRRNAPSIKAIQVEGVDAYQSTHGKKPRGTGLWVFQIGEDSGNTYSAETSFKEAQKQAKKQAQKEMKWSVKLLP